MRSSGGARKKTSPEPHLRHPRSSERPDGERSARDAAASWTRNGTSERLPSVEGHLVAARRTSPREVPSERRTTAGRSARSTAPRPVLRRATPDSARWRQASRCCHHPWPHAYRHDHSCIVIASWTFSSKKVAPSRTAGFCEHRSAASESGESEPANVRILCLHGCAMRRYHDALVHEARQQSVEGIRVREGVTPDGSHE